MENSASEHRATATRDRLLREVAAVPSCTTAELVARTGLHENTVRGHLDRLLADGRVRVSRDTPSGRGRPALRWQLTPPRSGGSYAALASTLADTLAQLPNGESLARITGEQWGRRIANERPPGDERDASTADARELVMTVMREEGFAPSASESPGEVHLRRCPLIDAAIRQPGVVCTLHEGMLEGIAATRTPGARVKMTPFAEGGACVATLRSASGRVTS